MQPGKRASDEHGGFRKRQKVSLACEGCRRRKIKCDGVKPVCGECAQRPNSLDSCRYRLHDHRDAEHDRYVESLLAKIKRLEQKAGSITPAPNIMHEHCLSPSPVQMTAITPNLPHEDNVEFSSIDGMGATRTIEPHMQDGHNLYYGSSSAASFMKEVHSTIWGASKVGSGPTDSNSVPSARDRSQVSTLGTLDQFSLLPRQLTDTVLRSYWDYVYHLYPFIHKPTFVQAYEQLWISDPSDDSFRAPGAGLGGSIAYGPKSKVFHCALNAMLALATQFMDVSPDERQRLSTLFWDRVEGLFQFNLLDDCSVAMIQTMLLMTQYLQATTQPTRCWVCIGIACRLAQGSGLHIQNDWNRTPLEIEIRRRVWHGCVLLDTVVSMSLGRPFMLGQSATLPYPTGDADEHLIDLDESNSHNLSPMRFFVETIKLYEIMASVVADLYHKPGNPEQSAGVRDILGSIDFIVESDKKIAAFVNQIPVHLNWLKRQNLPHDTRQRPPFEQQSSVLYVRYLYLKLLLYRATFTRYCQTVSRTEAEDVASSIAKSLSIACVRHAVQLIEQVHLRACSKVTGAWWYNLFYLRVSGIVVLLAMTSLSIVDAMSQSYLDAAWKNCQNALISLERLTTAAAVCLLGLSKLHDHIRYVRDQNGVESRHSIPQGSQQAQASFFNSSIPAQKGDLSYAWLDDFDAGAYDDIFSYEFGQSLNTSDQWLL